MPALSGLWSSISTWILPLAQTPTANDTVLPSGANFTAYTRLGLSSSSTFSTASGLHSSSEMARMVSTPAIQPRRILLKLSTAILTASFLTALSIRKCPRLGLASYHASSSCGSRIVSTLHSCQQVSISLPSNTDLRTRINTVPELPPLGGVPARMVWLFWLLPAEMVGSNASCWASVSSWSSSNIRQSLVIPKPPVRVRVRNWHTPLLRNST